eukprot:7715701-Pyramimonas_sp.AAC.1
MGLVAVREFAGEALLDPPPAPEQGARSGPGQGLTRNSTRLELAEAVLELRIDVASNTYIGGRMASEGRGDRQGGRVPVWQAGRRGTIRGGCGGAPPGGG